MSISDIVSQKPYTRSEATEAWKLIVARYEEIQTRETLISDDLVEFDRRQGWKAMGLNSMRSFLVEKAKEHGWSDRHVRRLDAVTVGQRAALEIDTEIPQEDRRMTMNAAERFKGVKKRDKAEVLEKACATARGHRGRITPTDIENAVADTCPNVTRTKKRVDGPGSVATETGSVIPPEPDKPIDPATTEADEEADFGLQDDFGEAEEVEEAGNWDTPFKCLNAPHRMLDEAKKAAADAECKLAEVARLKAYREIDVRSAMKVGEEYRKQIRFLTPYKLCETCGGKSCEACGMRGWLMRGDVAGFSESEALS